MYAHTCNAHTCKISPVKKGTYLNILDMMKSPEKGDSSGHLHTWVQLRVAELSRTLRPAKNISVGILHIIISVVYYLEVFPIYKSKKD